MKRKTLLMSFIANNQCIKDFFRIMRLSILLLFACVCPLMANTAGAQNLEIKLRTTEMTIRQLVKEIEAQTDYLVVFRNQDIDLEEKVSFDTHKAKVSELLDAVAQNAGISYHFENNYITLVRQPATNAQDKHKVMGRIIDINGAPIIGANVIEKGTTNGTITDMDGRFVLEVSDGTHLIVSFIGYNTQNIPVSSNKDTYEIQLTEDTKTLEEVVVVGYGTQKKGEIASAISSIKSEKFIKTPSTDAAQLIKGQVPGLSITTPDANPTSTSEISLRGITTLKASASPLVLIDGIPGDLNQVSPDDIQQIDVLKDGSAAAIYGTRGTNGVILITTKNSQGEMPTEVDVNAYISTQQIVKRLPFMDVTEYRQRVQEKVPGAQDDGATTDWLDEVTRTPFTQIYNISLRGGSKNTNYVASFEYRGLNGLIKRTNNQMYYPRIEITHRMFNNKLKLNASLSGYKQSYFSGSDGGSYNSGIYNRLLLNIL